MADMFITPMQRLDTIGGLPTPGASPAKGTSGLFNDFLQSSIANVIETDAAVKADSVALSTGNVDDLHTLTIDQTKAQLSIELMIQIRNRLLDSYNEIMRINF